MRRGIAVNDGVKEYELLKQGNEAVSKAQGIIEYLKGRKLDTLTPSMLSDIGFRLKGYTLYIGQLTAYYNCDANDAYIYKKFVELSEFNKLTQELNVKVTMAKEMGDYKALDEASEHNKRRYMADMLKILYDEATSWVMYIQTLLNRAKRDITSTSEK